MNRMTSDVVRGRMFASGWNLRVWRKHFRVAHARAYIFLEFTFNVELNSCCK